MDEQLIWIVRALVLAGIFAMFKIWDRQRELTVRLEVVEKAGQAATEQARIQLKSIGALRDVVSAQSGQVDHLVKESARSFKYHEQHFGKIEDIQLKMAESGGNT